MSYTDHPNQMPGIIFPNQGMQTLSSVIHLTGCSILAFCFARRTKNLFSWDTWAGMAWPRLCILIVFADSWLFLFSTGILINGAGMSTSFLNCALGIYACVLFYAFSKVMIYWFLAEKVYIVWGGTHQPRSRSKVYWICIATMTPYVGIVIIMLVGRVAYFRENRACVIGLKNYASLTLLVYDLYINVFLTGMFLWPLFRSRLANPRIRRMAMRTLVAAAAALTTSTINIAVLTIMHGQQLGWVCLGSCGADVTMNALVLFWVTDNQKPLDENTPGAGAPVGVPGHAQGATQGVAGTGPIHSPSSEDGAIKSPGGFGSGRTDSVYDYMPHNAGTRAPTRGRRSGEVVLSKEYKEKKRSVSGIGGNILGKIGGTLKSRSDERAERNHQVSVQVTVLTEQHDDIMMNAVKYEPSSDSIRESTQSNGSKDAEAQQELGPDRV